MISMKKEVREVLRYAEDRGFVCVGQDGSNHWRLRHPSGAHVTLPSSPGKHRRWDKNAKAKINRIHKEQS